MNDSKKNIFFTNFTNVKTLPFLLTKKKKKKKDPFPSIIFYGPLKKNLTAGEKNYLKKVHGNCATICMG